MYPLKYPRGYPGTDAQCYGAESLTSSLPDWLTFTRGASRYSQQTGPAVDGTTFISLGNTANAARFDYVSALGRRCFILEPARLNVLTEANFVDTAPANDIPDGWTAGAGVAGTAYSVTDTGAPHNGAYLTIEDLAVADGTGVYLTPVVLNALTTYTSSVWCRRTGTAGAANVYAHALVPGTSVCSIGAVLCDWTLFSQTEATVGAGNVAGCLRSNGDPPGVVRLTMPQCEEGTYPSTWIWTSGGAASRLAEVCDIAAARMNVAKGSIQLVWTPYFSNTEVAGTATIIELAANDRIEYEGGGDTIRVINNGVTRATSAALTFARRTPIIVRMDYGAFGTRLYVNGTLTSNANAWVAPGAIVGYLGSSAGANCESATYSFLKITG